MDGRHEARMSAPRPNDLFLDWLCLQKKSHLESRDLHNAPCTTET